jgi:Tol biopolymer transport system component
MFGALNHPNIAPIYGLEEFGSGRALVMELVEGPTLADRIARGPIALDETLPIAKQIAEALEYAHDHGVVHRDLKPANIKVTADGAVKVLDFGLAKALMDEPVAADPRDSPTLSMAPTMTGVILGTAAYMSPEQARGKTIDKRTDIWAFGCVLYELLTGKQALQGEDITDILAAVVRADPDWDRLPQHTPPSVRMLLHRCLQKDKTLRIHDAADVRIEIVEALTGPKDTGAAHPALAKLPWAVAAALAIIAAVALLGWWRSSRPAELKPLVRLDVDLGSDVSLGYSLGSHGGVDGADVILSPDGTRMVYVSQGKLFTRKLDQPKATELAGTEGAFAPFFSPDGRWVAFFAETKLKKLSVEGGAPVVLCDAARGSGGSWGEDGNIIASLSFPGALSRVSSTGGTPTPVTELAQGEVNQAWPQILPGGKAVLFTSNVPGDLNLTGFNEASTSIEVISLKDRRPKTLLKGIFGRYLATSDGGGHLVYINNGTLFAVAFDLNALDVRGTPVPLLEQVAYNPQSLSAQFDFSQTGKLLYRSGGTARSGEVTVQWLDSEGKTQPLLAKPDSYLRPSLSPDGARLAIASSDVWVYDWQRDTMMRLTFGARAIGPIWSPDGRYILFQGPGGMFGTRSDGSGKSQSLTQSKNAQVPWSITADGKRLAFHEVGQTSISIWTVDLENDGTGPRVGKPELFSQTRFDEMYPSFSPDGRWLAYASNESGTAQVYVRAFPGKEGKWQISNNGGVLPEWAHNGRELFFRTLDNQIMTAGYTVRGDSFVADKPRVWSEKRIANLGLLPNYGLTPDGKRIVALLPAESPQGQQAQNHVIFLENFFDELRRKVPLSGK